MAGARLRGGLQPFVPWVTYGIIIGNFVVYAWTMWLFASGGYDSVVRFYDALGFHPGGGQPAYRVVLSMLTMAWVHSPSPDHVGMNMLLLYFCGPAIEQSVGRLTYGATYVVGNLGACLAHWAVLSLAHISLDVPTIGASGAVTVIMGAFAVRFYRTPLRLSPRRLVQFPAAIILGAFIGREVRSGLLDAFAGDGSGSVANWVHVGGFIAGAAISFATGGVRQGQRNVALQSKPSARREREALICELAGVVSRDPEDGEACFRLAFELDRLGDDPASAIGYYEHALRTLARQGNRRRAIEAYVAHSHAHAFQSLPPGLHALVALCYETTEQYDAAVHVCELVAAMPQASAAEVETALWKAALLSAEKLGDGERAARSARELLARFPGSPHTEAARGLAGRAD